MKLPSLEMKTAIAKAGERKFKCGLIPSKRKFRAARLADHITASLPAPSPELDLYSKVSDYPMYGNDQYGCCGFAAVGHSIDTWTANASGKTVHVDTDQLIRDYFDCTGGVDSGVTEDQLISYWKTKGICGKKIVGDCEVDKGDPILQRQALEIFGNLQIGLLLAENWTEDDIFWDANAGRPGFFMGNPRGDAGHWVDASGTKIVNGRLWIVIVTWAGLKYLAFEAVAQYGMFVNAALSEDWVDKATAKSPTGVDVAGLIADMDALNGPDPAPVWPGPIPVPPAPTPVPTPTPPAPTPTPTPAPEVTLSQVAKIVAMDAAGKVLAAFVPAVDPAPTPKVSPVQVRFQSWISSGLDSISAIAKTARYLAQTYGPDAYAVFNATADLAINRDIESALKLKTAIDQLVSDIQGKQVPASVKFGFGPSDVIGWIQLAELVAQLIQQIRGGTVPPAQVASIPHWPVRNSTPFIITA